MDCIGFVGDLVTDGKKTPDMWSYLLPPIDELKGNTNGTNSPFKDSTHS